MVSFAVINKVALAAARYCQCFAVLQHNRAEYFAAAAAQTCAPLFAVVRAKCHNVAADIEQCILDAVLVQYIARRIQCRAFGYRAKIQFGFAPGGGYATVFNYH